jgi:hypothetical protein
MIVGGSACLRDLKYALSHWYVEFENVGDPEDEVTPPAVDGSDEGSGIAYFNALSSSDVRDYLRVPIAYPPAVGVLTGYEGLFLAGQGNTFYFQGVLSGSEGRHGVTFSNASNSKVFGIALAASPVPDDPSQDLVFGRWYADDDTETLIVPVSNKLVVSRRLNFPLPA